VPKVDSGFPISKSCLGLSGAGLLPGQIQRGIGRLGKGRARQMSSAGFQAICHGVCFAVTLQPKLLPKVWRPPLALADARLCQGRVCMVSPVCCNPAQAGINSVWKMLSTAMYSKNSFPGCLKESNPGRDWPHVYLLPYMYLTPFNFQYFGSQTGREALDYQFSLGSGPKSY